jgi:hypothetical protein
MKHYTPQKSQLIKCSNSTQITTHLLKNLSILRDTIKAKTREMVYKINFKIIEDWNSYWSELNELINITKENDPTYWNLLRKIMSNNNKTPSVKGLRINNNIITDKAKVANLVRDYYTKHFKN